MKLNQVWLEEYEHIYKDFYVLSLILVSQLFPPIGLNQIQVEWEGLKEDCKVVRFLWFLYWSYQLN